MAKCRNCSSTSATATAPLTSSQAGSTLQTLEHCACPVLSAPAAPPRLAVAPLATSPSPLAGVKSLQLPGPSAMLGEVPLQVQSPALSPQSSQVVWSAPQGPKARLSFTSPGLQDNLRTIFVRLHYPEEHEHREKAASNFLQWNLFAS